MPLLYTIKFENRLLYSPALLNCILEKKKSTEIFLFKSVINLELKILATSLVLQRIMCQSAKLGVIGSMSMDANTLSEKANRTSYVRLIRGDRRRVYHERLDDIAYMPEIS